MVRESPGQDRRCPEHRCCACRGRRASRPDDRCITSSGSEHADGACQGRRPPHAASASDQPGHTRCARRGPVESFRPERERCPGRIRDIDPPRRCAHIDIGRRDLDRSDRAQVPPVPGDQDPWISMGSTRLCRSRPTGPVGRRVRRWLPHPRLTRRDHPRQKDVRQYAQRWCDLHHRQQWGAERRCMGNRCRELRSARLSTTEPRSNRGRWRCRSRSVHRCEQEVGFHRACEQNRRLAVGARRPCRRFDHLGRWRRPHDRRSRPDPRTCRRCARHAVGDQSRMGAVEHLWCVE